MPGPRTDLAWQRTGLAFAAVGAVLLHAAGRGRWLGLGVPGLLGIGVGAAILFWAGVVGRSRASGRPRTVSPWPVAALALAAVVLGLGALALVLAPGGP
jgi:uncharacterized membrane protein YidH (DUF202 family)